MDSTEWAQFSEYKSRAEAAEAKLQAAEAEVGRLTRTLAQYKSTHATSVRLHDQNNELRFELSSSYDQRNQALAERDAAVAVKEAAEGALRHTCKHLCQWKDACDTGCLVSAILAGHAPAPNTNGCIRLAELVSQYKTISACPECGWIGEEMDMAGDVEFCHSCHGDKCIVEDTEEAAKIVLRFMVSAPTDHIGDATKMVSERERRLEEDLEAILSMTFDDKIAHPGQIIEAIQGRCRAALAESGGKAELFTGAPIAAPGTTPKPGEISWDDACEELKRRDGDDIDNEREVKS